MATVESRLAVEPVDTTGKPPALEAQDLVKQFGTVRAVDGLTLRVAAGETFCLLGPNGAGKTTTINMFLGFVEPTEGSVRVAGVDVQQNPLGSKRHLAYIPEQVMLYRNLTGVENLEYFSALSGCRHDRMALLDYLVRSGLPAEAAERRVGSYSKGMRQKVGIAIALAKQATALLLDEPTSGLDPKASNEFSHLLAQLRAEGVAILMATHDLFRARDTGTRVGIMRHGRLVVERSTADLDYNELEQLYLQTMTE